MTASNGCDSIVYTKVSVMPPLALQQSFLLCYGDSVYVGSNVYSNPGNYIDTLSAFNGCDSVVYTNISVAPPNVWQQAFSICDGDSIVVGNNIYHTAGYYVDTLSYSNICDTIIHTNIQIDYKSEDYSNNSSDVYLDFIEGKMGYYCLAAETSISNGTAEAAWASLDVALSGTEYILAGDRSVFSLCRPPGHHASHDQFGGYCFINNAAVAAQHLRDRGLGKVAVLDVDFHHGNGTQAIFYDRSDVLFLSLHGDPMHAFPHFLAVSYTHLTLPTKA